MVSSISEGPYSKYVRYLHYHSFIDILNGYRGQDSDSSAALYNEYFLPATEQILLDLNCFPKLEGLTIEFGLPQDWSDDFDHCEEEESREAVMHRETTKGL